MSTTKRIAKNTTVLFISTTITYLLAFFMNIYMAQYLGASGFGIISYALAFTGILIVTTELGLSTLTVREVARDKSLSEKYSNNTLLLKIGLSIFTFLLFVLISYFNHNDATVSKVLYLIGASYIISAFSGVYYSIFQAHEQMEYVSIVAILNSVIMLTGVIVAIHYNANIVIFAFLYFFANLITLLYYISVMSWKLYIPKLEFDWDFWKYLVKVSLPFAVATTFSLIAFQIDQVILPILLGSYTAVGYYSAAYKLLQALMFLPSVYVTAILPVFSKLHVSSKASLKFGYIKSFKYLTILGLPIAVGTTLLAKDIILLIYKSGFYPSILALQILIWAIPIIFLNYLLGTSITSIDKQRETVKIIFLSMVLNIGLNVIFIPKYSFIAAAVITVITELFVCIWYIRIMYLYGYKVRVNIFFKPVIASIVMGLFIFFVHTNLFITIIIATIIYFGVLILLKEFSEEDINIVEQIIRIPLILNILRKLI